MARKSLLADITSVFSSNIFAILLALAISIILYRQLGAEGYGLYNAILVIPMLVISFSQLGMRASAIYHIGNNKYDIDRTVSSVFFILILSSIAGIIITIFAFLLMGDHNYSVFLVATVVLMIPFRLAALYIGGIFLGKEQIRRANSIRWVPVLLNLLLVVALVWMISMDVLGALLSMMISFVVISVWAFFLIRKEYAIRIRPDWKVIKGLVKMGVLYALSFLVIQMNYRIDILILERLSSLQDVGHYSLGVAIAEKIWQLPLAIGIVLMSRTANEPDQEAIGRSTARLLRVSLIIAFLASAAIFILAPFVVPAIWGKESIASVRLLQYILPGILFISVYRIISSRLAGMGLPHISIYVFVPTLVINVVVNYWLIPVYGAMGAVIATNVSYILGSVAYLIVYSKIVHMKIFEILRYKKSDFQFINTLIERVFPNL